MFFQIDLDSYPSLCLQREFVSSEGEMCWRLCRRDTEVDNLLLAYSEPFGCMGE